MGVENLDNSLSVAEEMILLQLHDEDGTFIKLPDWAMRYTLCGAVLMDLALQNRIDTDLESLFVVDRTPTSDTLLNSLLAHVDKDQSRPIRYWVERIAVHADQIREVSLQRLIDRGILEQEEHRFLWVFKSRRYPVIDGTAETEAKRRILDVLWSDKIPDPRDVVLICLADVCGVFSAMFTTSELSKIEHRVKEIRQLDLIGQAVASAIWDIEVSLAIAAQPPFH